MPVNLVWSLDSLGSAQPPAAKLAMEPARDLTAEFPASADPASEAAPACRQEMADSHPESVAVAAADLASKHPASARAPADRPAVVVAPDQPSDFPVSCRPVAARLSAPPSQALAPSVRQSPAWAVLPAAPPPALAVPARLRGVPAARTHPALPGAPTPAMAAARRARSWDPKADSDHCSALATPRYSSRLLAASHRRDDTPPGRSPSARDDAGRRPRTRLRPA